VASIFGHSDNAEELRTYLQKGKKIIVTTVQKFPFILDELGDLSGKKLRPADRRGAFQPGRQDHGQDAHGPVGRREDDEDDEESVEDAEIRS
jgi:type I restriction enzyme, R subunit